MTTDTIHPAVRVGHVHLRVSDLDRGIAFYRDVLGFEVRLDLRSMGIPAVFLAAGDYHHHVALNTFESEGATPAPAGHTGLFHVAFLYPDRRELACAVQRVLDRGHAIDHVTDHGVSVGVHLCDPDGNGIELCYDRPRSEWFRPDGGHVVMNRRIDVGELLGEEVAA